MGIQDYLEFWFADTFHLTMQVNQSFSRDKFNGTNSKFTLWDIMKSEGYCIHYFVCHCIA